MLGLLVAALALAVTGCSAVEDKIGEEVAEGIIGSATGTDVEMDDDSVTISGDDGDVTVSGGTEVPKEFPDDFPLHDTAELDSVSSIESGDEASFFLSMTSSESADDMYEWYKSELDDEGWEIVSDMKTTGDGGTTAIISAKKDNLDGSVTIDATDAGSDIGVIVTEK